MTPLQIQMLLHWHYGVDDPDMSSTAAKSAVQYFEREELIRPHEPDEHFAATWQLTSRGEIYVEALKALPLPNAEWRFDWKEVEAVLARVDAADAPPEREE